jgi:predicted alpha/beta superfamily hydrolase
MKRNTVLIPALLFTASISVAQEQPGNLDSIYSGELKEMRLLQVVLPPGYSPGESTKYDVTYVLDGESNTGLMSQVHSFVLKNGFMPPNIIVGIRNTSRDRDLTPTSGGNSSGYGGGPAFLSFLKKELVPYINNKYSVKGTNTLYGHSFGGLFAMYAFLQEPQLFDSYILSDPSFWWDNNSMQKLAKERLDPTLHANKSIWVTGRGGPGTIDMGIPAVDSVIQSKGLAGLQWKISEYPGETHNSIQLKSIYDGYRYLYTGYAAGIQFHPMNGTVVKGKPYKVWSFSGENAELRYTTDGTEPVKASPKVQAELVFDAPIEFTVRTFSHRGAFDKMVKATFRQGQVMSSIPKPKNAKQGGLNYSYYEGAWDSLPDFKKLKSVQTGLADKEFTFKKLPRAENFACVYEGYLEIKHDGYHIFGLNSDDGSRFWLGNQLLIDHDGLHGMEGERSYIVPLEKGFYPIRLEYFQKEGGANLHIVYVTPDKMAPAPERIPPEVMYYK